MYCGSCVAGKEDGLQNTSTSGTSSSSKEKSSSISKHKRFEMTWTVDLDPGWLPDNKKTLQLCRESFSFLYGFSPNLMKKTSKKMKTVMSAGISSIKTERAYDHRSYFGSDYSIEDIQSIFDANGLECNYAEKRAALLRASNMHIDSMVWMEEYFYQYESQPNAAQIHVDATFKRTIWQEYCKAPLPSDGRLTEVRAFNINSHYKIINYITCTTTYNYCRGNLKRCGISYSILLEFVKSRECLVNAGRVHISTNFDN